MVINYAQLLKFPIKKKEVFKNIWNVQIFNIKFQ